MFTELHYKHKNISKMDMDLESLKYVELQRLAKDVGLKANMKVQ